MTLCPNRDCQQPENSDTAGKCLNCGAELLLAQRYRLYQLIAKSTLTRTFLALDELSQKPKNVCLIKEYKNYAQTPPTSEIEALKQLGRNSLIPDVLDFFQTKDNFYLVQEFIEGVNLAQHLAQKGSFSENQIWQILAEILPLLKFVHNHQVIHGDIKPENILRRANDDRLVLVGFGLESWQKGSPEYVAPQEEKPTIKDLYSLGVTCLKLLTAISPFNLFDVVNNQWVWQDYLIKPVSQEIAKILDKLISLKPEDRFTSVEDALAAIKQAGRLTAAAEQMPKRSLWQCVATMTPQTGMNAQINTVAISLDHQTLASAGDGRTVKIWSLNQLQEIASLTGHSQPVNSVAFGSNHLLASSSDDRTIKLWDLTKFEQIFTFTGHTGFVKQVCFSPDHKIIASASWDKTVKLWDVNTGQLLHSLIAHKLQVLGVAFSPDGDWLASVGIDRTLRLWKLQPQPKLHLTMSDHTGSVIAVAFSPSGKIIATGGDDRTIKLWELATGKLVRTLAGHSWSVVSLKFSPDSKILISASWDKTIKIWHTATGEELEVLKGHGDCVSEVAISFDGQLIASSSKDTTIKLWHPTYKLLKIFDK